MRDQLLKEAEELNISVSSGIYKPANESWKEIQITEYELQRRISEEKRHRQEYKLFWVALVSSIASMLSALAAFLALAR